jgi:tight adherence protein C
VVIAALACAWAALVALPLVGRARRITVSARAASTTPVCARTRAPARVAAQTWSGRLGSLPAARSVLRVARAPARTRAARHHADALLRELVVTVDLIGVGVAAGCTPYLATELGARWSGPLLGDAFREVLRACSMGQSFDEALRSLGLRVAPVRPLTETLRASARLGSPAAPALARLAADVRADLRRRAEARARTVPVRLCFPLVACVLPAFALLTVVPVVLDGLHR